MRFGDRPKSHPRSPVQHDRSRPGAVLMLAALAAVTVWTVSQYGFDDDVGGSARDRAPSDESTSPADEANVGPRRARANLASFVSNDDYPEAAIRAAEQGTVGFALSVGPDGRVKQCTIVQSSGHNSLDQETCSIMHKRARFQPARDGEGRSISDTVNSRIRWVLPDE